MQGIILVGGEGTRLRPLTYGTPKAMVPILGRPFLEHMLVYLRRHGVTDVSLAMGYKPDPIRAYFGDGSRWGMKLTMVVEAEPLGSAGAIKQFEGVMQQPFFAFNGDILTNMDMTAMRETHQRTRAAVSIFLLQVEDPSAFGVVAIDAGARIRRFVEKPPRAEAPSRWANAGVWLFEPSVLPRIPAGRRSMVETELFPELIAASEHVQGHCEQCFWVDIGTPERYLDVQLQMLAEPSLCVLPLESWPGTPYLRAESGVEHPPHVASGATIEGPVILGSSVVVAAGAQIIGPAAIGAGSHLAAGCRVERSVLWDGVHVGSGAGVESSVLCTRVRVGAHATVQSVIAGHNVTFADGVTAANLRVEPETAFAMSS